MATIFLSLIHISVGTDVETRSYNFYLVRFCMYIEWDILVFGYFNQNLWDMIAYFRSEKENGQKFCDMVARCLLYTSRCV